MSLPQPQQGETATIMPSAESWLRPASVSTIAAVVLYVLGVYYYRGYYGHYGLDATVVNIPLYTLLLPQGSSAICMVYFVSSLAASLIGSVPPASEPRRSRALLWIGRLAVVTGVVLVVAKAIREPTELMAPAFGFGAGVVAASLTRPIANIIKLLLGLSIASVAFWVFSNLGRYDAENKKPLTVWYLTQKPEAQPLKAFLITYDQINYFFQDYHQPTTPEPAQRRLRVVPNHELRYVELTFR